jgi:glycosyltransferase involved in cell wall biosynthesis
VTFAGRVAPDAVARYYDENDIYIQSPDIDNMPTSIIEAYASGLPVVSTDAGGVPAILTSGVHGLLAPLNGDDVLAAHVLRLLNEPVLADRLAAAGRAAAQACTWDRVRDAWLHEYRAVLRPPVGDRSTALDPVGRDAA